MMSLRSIYLLALMSILLAGCAGTIPVKYSAQNIVRYNGRVDMARFVYVPAQVGKVASNQIENTAPGGSIYIGANIADLVRRATALELEKTGFQISEIYPIQLSGEVLEFKVDDLGFNAEWRYSVRYKITRKSDRTDLLNKVYVADPRTTGKLGVAADYAPSVNEMILSGYEKFIRDEQVRKILSQ